MFLGIQIHFTSNLTLSVAVWQIPDAVDTVVCAPDDGWRYHPKHVELFPYINKLRNNVQQLHVQQPSTHAKPEAPSAVLCSWWWVVCRPKNVELYTNMKYDYSISVS